MSIPWERFKTTPRDHQRIGVQTLTTAVDVEAGRTIPWVFLLGDEVGAGKSKQAVDAACVRFDRDEIDTIVVIAPAFARGVWSNPNPVIGEVSKHTWAHLDYTMQEYSVNRSKLGLEMYGSPKPQARTLEWIVTNYEFIRQEDRLQPLLKYLLKRRFWLICDEAWALKDHMSKQFKATAKLRKLADQVTLLNGTPVADSPLDLFAQFKLLDTDIIGISGITNFRARYAILRPNVTFPLITGWQNLDELRMKVAPYILRRKTRECFDLPPVLDPVIIESKMDPVEWKSYVEMRDDMVAWISNDSEDLRASVTKQAIVRGIRLAQITSGFLGGVVKMDGLDGADVIPDHSCLQEPSMPCAGCDALLVSEDGADQAFDAQSYETQTVELGQSKLDALVAWLAALEPQPERLLVWCRFRPEIERTARVLAETPFLFGGKKRCRRVHLLYGTQKKADREAAIGALNPDLEPGEPVVVVGTPAAGGAGLNLSGASMAINLSHDFNLRIFLQARGRIDRPGQKNPIRYVDVVATGPKGQRTINHHVLAALRSKERVAEWTAEAWIKKLMEE